VRSEKKKTSWVLGSRSGKGVKRRKKRFRGGGGVERMPTCGPPNKKYWKETGETEKGDEHQQNCAVGWKLELSSIKKKVRTGGEVREMEQWKLGNWGGWVNREQKKSRDGTRPTLWWRPNHKKKKRGGEGKAGRKWVGGCLKDMGSVGKQCEGSTPFKQKRKKENEKQIRKQKGTWRPN